MKRSAEVTLVISAVAVLFVVMMSAIATVKYWPSGGRVLPANSNELAAWIQAIGTIGALLGAFFLGSHQVKAAHESAMNVETERRKANQRGYLGVVEHMISETADAMKLALHSGSLDGLKRQLPRLNAKLAAAVAIFDSLPIYELGSLEVIRQAFEGRKYLEDVLAHVSGYANFGKRDPLHDEGQWISFTQDADVWIMRADELRSQLVQATQ